MDAYRTDEEQVVALKTWWKENGNSLLIGIGLAIAIIFGWKAYQQNTAQKHDQSFLLLQELMQVSSQKMDEKAQSTALFLSQKLRDEFSGTESAVFGAWIAARISAEKGDYAAAETELRWALDQQDKNDKLKLVTTDRLVRVVGEQERFDDAIALIPDAKTAGAFAAYFLELKGDLALRKGDDAVAREAYRQAHELAQNGEYRSLLLDAKMADLAMPEAR